MATDNRNSVPPETVSEKIELLGVENVAPIGDRYAVVAYRTRIPLSRLIQQGEPHADEHGIASTRFEVKFEDGDDSLDFPK